MARTDESHKDLPRKEIMALANLTIIRSGGPERASVYFKYTCGHCGARQTFETANTCYTDGECSACGKETKNIKAYGFLLAVTMGGADQNNDTKPGEDD